MSTKTKQDKAANAKATEIASRKTAAIRTGLIDDAPWNVHEKEAASDETFRGLVDSIRANGIIHRILVRQKADGSYEVVDGHRRMEAARRIGIENVPCEVIEADDETAKILTATANIQRIENDPFLEAELIGKLRKKGMEMREIAARMGKSAAYVARRARLLELTDAWRDFAKTHECTLEMLENVSSHEKELQDRVAESEDIGSWDAEGVTYGWEDVENTFNAALRSLADVPFDAKECASCRHNTAGDALLFPFLNENGGGRCQNAACFARKWEAWIEATLAGLRAKGRPAIEVADRWHIPDYWDAAEARDRKHPQAYVYTEGGLRRIRWAKEPEEKPKEPEETAEQKAERKRQKARERALSAACHRVRDAFREADRSDVAGKMRDILHTDAAATFAAADYFASKACGYATLDECATLVKVCGGPAQFAQTFLGDAAAFPDAERDALTADSADNEGEDGSR